MLADKLETQIQFVPVPWKRCLEDLKANVYDGAFSASYKAERLEFGVYPTIDEKPDESKRIHISEYALYIKKGNKTVKWDGKELTGTKTVASLPAHSIIDFLKKMKLEVDDGTPSPTSVFEKLVRDRFPAAAIQAYRGDYLLENNPQLKDAIEKTLFHLKKRVTMFCYQNNFLIKIKLMQILFGIQ